jgi:hypothetical protein
MLDSETPYELAYTLDVPKSFAGHVDDLGFSQAPTQIIDPDPVVVFGISSDEDGGMITVDSAHVQADGQDVMSVLNVLQGFQYEHTKRFCAEARGGNRARCYMALATNFPDHVTDGDCDQVYTAVRSVSANANDEWYLTCRAILTRDPWECSRIEGSEFQREACINNLGKVMRDRCALLSGAVEAACLAEGGITSGSAASTGNAGSSSTGGQTGSPVREGIYHMVGDSWGTLWEGNSAAHTDAYVALKYCDDQQRPDYIGALDAASISMLCVRPEDEYYNHFRFVSPGVFEKPLLDDTQGFARLTIETPTRLVYYSEGVYAGGYTDFTEIVLEWYSDFE